MDSGFPTLNAFIKERQSFFYKGIFATGRGMTDDPLMLALSLAEAGNTKPWLHIKSVMAESDNILRKDRLTLREQALNSRHTLAHIWPIIRHWR